MRKYQQLLLLVVSCISLIVLFIYKSENNRLKYVLQVVNFFGRRDSAIFAQFENATGDNVDFAHPLPVWQLLDESFHAYTAYWIPEHYGGNALAEVVAKSSANVLFHCHALFPDNSKIEGKFRFQLFHKTPDKNNDYIYYSFFCQINHNKQQQPESIVFTPNRPSKQALAGVPLHLRPLSKNAETLPLTICVDLASLAGSNKQFVQQKKNMLQFFLHHKFLGVEHFLVYNGDALPSGLVRLLTLASIQLHLLPFNFPFALANGTDMRLRQFIEVDCLRRSAPAAQHAMMLAANEFFYTKSKLNTGSSMLQTMNQYEKQVTYFRAIRVEICLNAQKPLLIDNTDNLASQTPSDTLIYRLKPLSMLDPMSLIVGSTESPALPLSLAYVHAYVDCLLIGADGVNDWRTTLRDEFIRVLQSERNELSVIIK